jgi:uncharacterized membrane protein YhaH (DUF805 family)
MNWYLLAFKKYATFSGRSRRQEYWMFFLFNVIISIVLALLDQLLGLKLTSEGINNTGVLGVIYSLATFVPGLSIAVRRLHDTNRSGWFLLMPIAPYILVILGLILRGFGSILIIIGGLAVLGLAILLIVWLATEGTSGENQYGSDPKGTNGFSSNDLLDN